jgi:hypothetical protein
VLAHGRLAQPELDARSREAPGIRYGKEGSQKDGIKHAFPISGGLITFINARYRFNLVRE